MRDIKDIVRKIFELLNDLEDLLQDKYRQSPDNPSLIIQLQAARTIRITLNNVFPYKAEKVVIAESIPQSMPSSAFITSEVE